MLVDSNEWYLIMPHVRLFMIVISINYKYKNKKNYKIFQILKIDARKKCKGNPARNKPQFSTLVRAIANYWCKITKLLQSIFLLSHKTLLRLHHYTCTFHPNQIVLWGPWVFLRFFYLKTLSQFSFLFNSLASQKSSNPIPPPLFSLSTPTKLSSQEPKLFLFILHQFPKLAKANQFMNHQIKHSRILI